MRQEWVINKQKVVQNDCLAEMREMKGKVAVDVVVTSPPYNLDIKYNTYDDKVSFDDYFIWLYVIAKNILWVTKDDGSLFLNIGSNCKNPCFGMRVCEIFRNAGWVLQNNIIWVKSITIDDTNYGHFKPVKGDRFLNNQHESIFHFTKFGDVKVKRLNIGVPYSDKFNVKRWKGKKADIRCGGNTWFLPYKTYSPYSDRNWEVRKHPAGFPLSLPEKCIKLHGVTDDMIVFDPFLGAGTTLMACQELGVSGIGVEIDDLYCEISCNVLKGMNGQSQV